MRKCLGPESLGLFPAAGAGLPLPGLLGVLQAVPSFGPKGFALAAGRAECVATALAEKERVHGF